MPPRKKKTPAPGLPARIADLGPSGRELWDLLTQTRELVNDDKVASAASNLALEACRAVDRLDQLDQLIQGRGAERLLHCAIDDLVDSGDSVRIEVTVTVDQVLAEARQQQNALRQILSTLGIGQLEAKKKGGGIRDQLAARRASREGGRSAAARRQPS